MSAHLQRILHIIGCGIGADLQMVHTHHPQTSSPCLLAHVQIPGCLPLLKLHARLSHEVPRPIHLHNQLSSGKPEIHLAMPTAQFGLPHTSPIHLALLESILHLMLYFSGQPHVVAFEPPGGLTPGAQQLPWFVHRFGGAQVVVVAT